MRAPIVAVVFCLLAAACSGSSPDSAVVSSTATSLVPTVSPGIPDLLRNSEVKDVVVGDRTLRLAIADSPSLRSSGLMGVTVLGSLDGMLFYWRHEASEGFWMKDTLIPLDIVWFGVDGAFVGRESMVPCLADSCEVYAPDDGVDYRFAIEANPGELDWVTPTLSSSIRIESMGCDVRSRIESMGCDVRRFVPQHQ